MRSGHQLELERLRVALRHHRAHLRKIQERGADCFALSYRPPIDAADTLQADYATEFDGLGGKDIFLDCLLKPGLFGQAERQHPQDAQRNAKDDGNGVTLFAG